MLLLNDKYSQKVTIADITNSSKVDPFETLKVNILTDYVEYEADTHEHLIICTKLSHW